MFTFESLAGLADIIAQTTAPTTRPASGIRQIFDSFGIMLPLVLVMIIFMVMSSRARKKQERQKQDMLGAMKRGDRVQTIGGILGNVVETREDRILIKVDEGNNTKVWFARSAIARVVEEDKAEAK